MDSARPLPSARSNTSDGDEEEGHGADDDDDVSADPTPSVVPHNPLAQQTENNGLRTGAGMQ